MDQAARAFTSQANRGDQTATQLRIHTFFKPSTTASSWTSSQPGATRRLPPSQKMDIYDIDSVLSDFDDMDFVDATALPTIKSPQRATAGTDTLIGSHPNQVMSPTVMFSSPTHHVAAARRTAGLATFQQPKTPLLTLKSAPRPNLTSLKPMVASPDARSSPPLPGETWTAAEPLEMELDHDEILSLGDPQPRRESLDVKIQTPAKPCTPDRYVMEEMTRGSPDDVMSHLLQQNVQLRARELTVLDEGGSEQTAVVRVNPTSMMEPLESPVLGTTDRDKQRAADKARRSAEKTARKVQKENQLFQSPRGDKIKELARHAAHRSPLGDRKAERMIDEVDPPESDPSHAGDGVDAFKPSQLFPSDLPLTSGSFKSVGSTHLASDTRPKYPELPEIHGRKRGDYIAAHGQGLALF